MVEIPVELMDELADVPPRSLDVWELLPAEVAAPSVSRRAAAAVDLRRVRLADAALRVGQNDQQFRQPVRHSAEEAAASGIRFGSAR